MNSYIKKIIGIKFLRLFSLSVLVCSSAVTAQVQTGVMAGEREALNSIVTKGVLPTLEHLSVTAEDLTVAINTLCKQPSKENIQLTKQQWQEAFLSWRRAAPFLFGPANKLERYIGQWPIEPLLLDGILKQPELKPMLAERDLRGYAAIEFMLYNYDSVKQVTAPAHCEHLIDISVEINQRIQLAKQQWQDDFSGTFLAAGDGQPYLTANDALSAAYAEPLNQLERLLWNGLGEPSGFFKTDVYPKKLDARHSGLTKQALTASIQGLGDALQVENSEAGFINLIATKNGLLYKKDPELAKQVELDYQAVKVAVNKLPTSIYQDLNDDKTLLKDLYLALNQLQLDLVQGSLVLELNVRSQDENHVD